MSKKLIYVILCVLVLGLTRSVDAELGEDKILVEWWLGFGGNAVADVRNHADYPDNPDGSLWLDTFEVPRSKPAELSVLVDSYGARLRGYLYPPADGDYTFWITSDNGSEFLLSTDDDPANATAMCQVPEGNWSGAREWDKFPTDQQSQPVTLQAGQNYYVEAIYKEGSGGDGVAIAWAGPSIGADPVIIDGQYLSALIRPADLMASNPEPADAAEDVQQPVLRWDVGLTAKWHNVYFGTSPDLGPDQFVAQKPYNLYYHQAGFAPGTTYYWRVDEVEADGVTIHTGNVWSFTVMPLTAWKPNPPDGATDQPFQDLLLTWSPGQNTSEHHVYFGTSFDDVNDGIGGTDKGTTEDAEYAPGTLELETTYYWRIDETDINGATQKGDVWAFTTFMRGPGKVIYEWWDGISGTAVADLTGSGNYPDNPSGSEYTDSMDGNVNWKDNYGMRLSGWLYPPATGTYTFWVAGDDNMELWLSTDEDPANAVQIANVPGYTSHNQWDKFTEQQSAPQALQAGKIYYIEAIGKEGGGGDSISVAWQGGPIVSQEIIGAEYVGATPYPPVRAYNPDPADGATDVDYMATLSWTPGAFAAQHDVYFGTDANSVVNADTTATGIYRGRQNATSYTPVSLDLDTTYYWRVDEVNNLHPDRMWKGDVWSFTTADFVIVEGFEDYTDFTPDRIWQTWLDGVGYSEPPPGYEGNGTGSQVGNDDSPFTEQTIVHSGDQAMTFRYTNDGSTGKALYSETERQWATPQDWTAKGVKSLGIWYQSWPRSDLQGSDSYDPATGTFTVTADGADIWGDADAFRYVYKRLSGNGEIVARVVRISGPSGNEWRKAGVMIRESLQPGSIHTFMAVTPGSAHGVAFQSRSETDQRSWSAHEDVTATVPAWDGNTYLGGVWVRLVRQGSSLTSYYSTNGANWTMVSGSADLPNPQTLNMNDPVYIGLAVTSHQADQLSTCVFDNVTATGGVSGQWQSQDIPSTDPGSLYVALQDSIGNIKAIPHPDPAATQQYSWTEWNIDLQRFADAGVNLGAVKKMYIGVGNRDNPQAGGSGRLYFDDIRLYPPRCMWDVAKPAGDFSNDCVVGHEDMQILGDNWLISNYDVTPADPGGASLVAYYALENNTQDSSGGGHHGDPCGAPSYVSGPAAYGTAMQFDGTGSQYVDLGTWNPSALTGQLTVALWARWNGLSGAWQGLIGKRDSWAADNMMWHLEAAQTTGVMRFGRNGIPQVPSVAMTLDEWAHWAAAFDGTTVRIYTNGEQTGSGDFSFGEDPNAVIVFGACNAGGGNPFNGTLDEIRIYDRPLTQGEVGYLAGKTATYTQPLSLLLDPKDAAIDMHADDTIDLKDFAVLVDAWLEELLWP
jgi:hypothetical protein